MTAGLDIATTADLFTDVITVVPTGSLTVETAPALRTALIKATAQCPDAVIVDLSMLCVDHHSRLAVFPAAAAQQAGPATPMLLAQPSTALAAMMAGGVVGDLAVYDTCAQATAAVVNAEAVAPRRIDLNLAPVLLSVIRARHTVGEACYAWRMPHVADIARLIISELVTNAVEHSDADIRMTAVVRRRYLHLRVRDNSRQPPVDGGALPDVDPLTDRGRGLRLVRLCATGWGTTMAPNGKTVWATIRVADAAA
jgi:hypothetical protein